MTKTKLEIIGPYTPDHEGPYATATLRSAQVLYEKIDVHCVVDGVAFVTAEYVDGPWSTKIENIMNAREVPVAREFWINKYATWSDTHHSKAAADAMAVPTRIACIHVREVLPGDE